jgi:hypothetical protein
MLEYACELWDGCSQQDSDNLEKLQIEAGRIVTGLRGEEGLFGNL